MYIFSLVLDVGMHVPAVESVYSREVLSKELLVFGCLSGLLWNGPKSSHCSNLSCGFAHTEGRRNLLNKY